MLYNGLSEMGHRGRELRAASRGRNVLVERDEMSTGPSAHQLQSDVIMYFVRCYSLLLFEKSFTGIKQISIPIV